jgi:hypothetical protein
VNLVALIYCEVMTGSREWIKIDEVRDWLISCLIDPADHSNLHLHMSELMRQFQHNKGHGWVEVGPDLMPRHPLTEHIALCDLFGESSLPRIQLSDKDDRSPLGLSFNEREGDETRSRIIFDIIYGSGEARGLPEAVRPHLDKARELADRWDEEEIAWSMLRWVEDWLRFGAWFRKTYPEHQPPPRSAYAEEIIEILDEPRLEIWNRHDLGRNFKKKAVQP